MGLLGSEWRGLLSLRAWPCSGRQPLLLSPVGDEGGDRAVVLVLCVCALAALLLGVGGFPRRGALC